MSDPITLPPDVEAATVALEATAFTFAMLLRTPAASTNARTRALALDRAALRRAALAYAAAKLEESGESGTLNAIVLLGQIADDM